MSSSRKTTTVMIGRTVQSLQRVGGAEPGAQPVSGAGTAGLPKAARPAQDRDAGRGEFERGVAAGLEQARRESAAAIQAFNRISQQLQAQSVEVQAALDRHAGVLAVRIAAKIIGNELNKPETALKMIAQALAQVPVQRKMKIRLNPRDAALLEGLRGKVMAPGMVLPEHVELAPDAGVSSGGCVIETPIGQMDARLETQLDLIERALGGSGTAEQKNA